MSDTDIRKYFRISWPALILIILISANLILFYLSQGENLERTIKFLENFTPTTIQEYLAGYGIYAPAVLMLLLIGQSLAAPIPGHFLIIAAGVIYGPVIGGAITIVCSLIGAALCFKISQHFGRPILERLLPKEDIKAIDTFVQGEKGFLTFLLIRLNPIMAFDVISYGAGLTKMDFKKYMFISGVAIVIGNVLYTTIGYEIIRGNVFTLFILSVVLIGLLLGIPIIHTQLESKKK